MRTLSLLLFLALTGCPKSGAEVDPYAAPVKNAGVPDRPEKLVFEEVSFTPPDPASLRKDLGDVPVFVATNTELPLVDLTLSFRAGDYLEPADKVGVAAATAELVRHGGSRTVAAAEVDERFAFLASNVSVRIGGDTTTVSVNCLKENLEPTLELLFDILRNPAWDTEKLALHQKQSIDRMRQRNDDAGRIAGREWAAMAYGRDHYRARMATQASIDSLDSEDLAALHAQIFHPGHLVIGVSGDTTADVVLPLLEKGLDGWEAQAAAPAPPAPETTLQAGLFHIQKDIPQGKVRIGFPGVERDHEDAAVLAVMNDILGGGGFTSRLTKRIRSDEGLAYGARSRFSSPQPHPGYFAAAFDSKNPTVALATVIVKEELERIRTEPVTAQELETAKASIIETFPARFDSQASTVSIFVNDLQTDRPEDHWTTWRDRIAAVTPEDIQRVAQERLHADQLTILIVGDWDPIAKGDVDGRANMAPFGEPTHLPLRDPMTGEAMP